MTDHNASTGQEKPKFYIAETYRHFRHYCHDRGISVNDRYFIGTDRIDRLKGMAITPDQIEICYDPRAAWSFWLELMSVVQRNAMVAKTVCPHCGGKRVDHNLECLDCDEPVYVKP